MLYIRHGGLRKELNIKTPFDAIETLVVSKDEPWFEINSKILKENPLQLKNKILSLLQKKSKFS